VGNGAPKNLVASREDQKKQEKVNKGKKQKNWKRINLREKSLKGTPEGSEEKRHKLGPTQVLLKKKTSTKSKAQTTGRGLGKGGF